jgi:hypothetical protein
MASALGKPTIAAVNNVVRFVTDRKICRELKAGGLATRCSTPVTRPWYDRTSD